MASATRLEAAPVLPPAQASARRLRRWAGWSVSGIVGAATLAAAAGFGPLVRARASEAAARRGLAVTIGAVRPGRAGVWLRDLRVTIPEVPAVELRLDAVEVQTGADGEPRRIAAHGGELRVRGSVAEVSAEWRRFREQARGPGGGGRGVEISVDGLAATWSEAAAGAPPAHAWGIRFARRGELEDVSADLVRAAFGKSSLELRGATVTLERRDGKRALASVSAAGVRAALDLDADAMPQGRPEPDARPAGVPDAPRAGDAERLPLPPLDPQRGPRLRAAFARLASLLQDVLPERGKLDLAGLDARLRHAGETLSVGPGRLRVSRTASSASVGFDPAPGAARALRVQLELPLGEGSVAIEVDGGPVSLATLGVREGDFGLLDVKRGEVEAKGKAVLSGDGSTLSLDGSGRVSGLAMQHRWLAAGPVHGIDVGWRGRSQVALDGGRVVLEGSALRVGSVELAVDGRVEREAGATRIDLRGRIPLASCQAMLDSIPEGMAPLLEGMTLDGTYSLDGRIAYDSKKPARVVTEWRVANECRFTGVPQDVAPERFARSFSREVAGADGRPAQIQSGPGTPGWVPYAAISRHVETAVLICEDGGFRRHRGFDEEAIRDSIRENLKAGRFVRGASTISMQLAKNLYLSPEKTLSRKLQEAALTLLLEQRLSKDQILELYLNAVEFGPGIYGIGPAASWYFATSAGELSLGQALYLASILPNPKQQHFAADGQVTAGWSNYLRRLMHVARKLGRIDDEELEDSLREQVTFRVATSPRAPAEGEDPALAATGKEGAEAEGADDGEAAPGLYDATPSGESPAREP